MRERSDFCLGGRPLFAHDGPRTCGALAFVTFRSHGTFGSVYVVGARSHHMGEPSRYRRCADPAVVEIETTLSQEWSRNSIRGPQCAFEMSMFKCPAVHKLTRN